MPSSLKRVLLEKPAVLTGRVEPGSILIVSELTASALIRAGKATALPATDAPIANVKDYKPHGRRTVHSDTRGKSAGHPG